MTKAILRGLSSDIWRARTSSFLLVVDEKLFTLRRHSQVHNKLYRNETKKPSTIFIIRAPVFVSNAIPGQ